MNHTEVSIAGTCQRVKDEINNVLDYTDIGKDDIFEVFDTDIMSISHFKRKGFYRVPCAACEAYLGEPVTRDGYQIYELAYQSMVFITGEMLNPFYRIISLKTKCHTSMDCNDSAEYYEQGVSLSQTGIYTIPTGLGRPVRLSMASMSDITQMSGWVASSGAIGDYGRYGIYRG